MVAQINLLPWREEARIAREKISKVSLIAALIIALILNAGYYFYNEKLVIKDVQKANVYLDNKNKEAKAKLKELEEQKKLRELLTSQVRSIETLQDKRAMMTHLLEDLAHAIKTSEESLDDNIGIFITDFQIRNGNVSMAGVSENDAYIASFMRSVENSDWYKDVELVTYNSINELGKEIKSFNITLMTSVPEVKEENNK